MHYRDAKRRWRDIDTKVERGAGSVPFVNHTNVLSTEFGTSTGRLVTLSHDGHTLSLAAGGQSRPVDAGASGSTVTFPDVFGAADLRYTVKAGALKEDIVVPDAGTASANPEFRFELDGHGLKAKALATGAVELYGKDPGRPAFLLPAPVMSDARGVTSHQVALDVTSDEGRLAVTVRPDAAWLRAPGRVFPVLVDPTITIVQPQDGTSDARIYEGTPTTAYPWDSQIPVGQNSSGLAHRGLFKFDLSAIPNGTTVRAARLNLHMSSPFDGDATAVPMTAHPITKAWDATTATWSSMSTAYTATTAYNQFLLDDTDTDNVSAGPWKDVVNAYAVGGTQAKLASGTTADAFEWNARVPWPGVYRVDTHFVPAAGQGSPTYVATGDTASSAPVAIDQTTGTATGVWKVVASNVHASPNKTTRVRMTRQGGTTATAPVADAIRWLEFATATKAVNERDAWHSFGVGTIVQNWINAPTTNFGIMVKATDESSTGPIGGPYYEAAEDLYGGESANRPQLVVIYGEPGPALDAPTVIHADGPELKWAAYNDPTSSPDDDLVEYQIWRGCVTLPGGACTTPATEEFTTTPSANLQLVGTVDTEDANELQSFTDSTAVSSSSTEKAVYRYWVVARTVADTQNGQDGRAASNEQTVTIPREGRIVRVLTGDISDTTLSAAKPTSNVSSPDATAAPNYRNWLQAGNSHATYGDERAVLEFDISAIKKAVKVTDARLELWESSGSGSGATFDLHSLTKDFVENQATWNQATSTVPWTTPGGDFDATALASVTTDNAPKRLTFASDAFRSKVQAWVDNDGDNHGFLLKARDEVASQQYLSLLNSEATDSLFRPRLVIEHLVKNDTEMIDSPQMPERFVPGTITTVPVTVTNTTDATWPDTLELSYRWTDPGQATDLTVSGDRNFATLGRALTPGESVKLNLEVRTPINSDTGAKRLAYDLYLDLWDAATSTWWSTAHPLVPKSVRPSQGCAMVRDGLLCVDRLVEDPTSNLLGLEQFASYAGEETGGATQALANLASGNMVWSYDAISNPSIGPSAFVRLAYNSMDATDAGAGYGISLQPATLNRYGSRLSVPSGGSTSNLMTFIDGDGTTHTYKLKTQTSTLLIYDRPAGVPLELTRDLTADEAHQWVFTRPDGTRFFFDQSTGLQTSTVDRNGNTLTYHYDTAKRGLLTSVTDSQNRTVLKLGYDDLGVIWVQDITCRALKFGYSSTHQLVTISDGGRFDPATGNFGTNAGGGTSWCTAPATAAPTKTFRLGYNTTSVNDNAQLISVTDPRGATSTIAYWGPEVPDSAFTLWAKSFTDRRGGVTTYDYADPDASSGKDIVATVTDQNGTTSSVTTYRMDGFGRTTSIKDANANAVGADDVTRLGWDSDHNVIRLEEPNGAVSTWEYDPNTGYPLVVKDAEAVKRGDPGIRLTYAKQSGPGRPTVLTHKTSGAGRSYDFTYDANGNLLTVRDGLGNGPTYTYNADGTLATETDANGGVTTLGAYDPSGNPLAITDALNATTRAQYDARGDVVQVTDPLDHVITAEYDDFGRPLATTSPGSDSGPRTTRTTYDPNDNVRTQTAPNGAVTSYDYDAADNVTAKHLPDNNVTGRSLTYAYDVFNRVIEETAPGGSATSDPDDFVTRYSYDRIGQVLKVTQPFVDGSGVKQTATTTYTYDKVGNRVLVVDPNKNASGGTDYTSRTVYDLDHRPTAVVDAAGYTTKTEYDADGLVTAQIDALGNRKRQVYDAAGRLIEEHVPHTPNGFSTARDQITKYAYDRVGNLTRKTRPTGFYTETVYDLDNRPIQTKSPFKTGDANYGTPANTYLEYDALGQLTRQSLPTYSTTKPAAANQWTSYDYYASGDIKTSTDPWSLVTAYAYNQNGQQTARTYRSTTDDATRTQTWDFYPDGALKAKTDQGSQMPVMVADNADAPNTTVTGTWSTVAGGTNTVGANYRTHAAAAAGTTAASDTFTWKLTPDISGTFDVYASCPVRTDSTTSAVFTVNHAAGATNTTVNEKACTVATPWIKLGSYSFGGGTTKTVTLKPAASGVTVADAVKLVSTGTPPTKRYSYTYDANGLQSVVRDSSTPAPMSDTYLTTYDGLGRASQVQEGIGKTDANGDWMLGTALRTTSYTYDLNSNLTSSYATRPATTNNADASRYTGYTWDVRNLVDTVRIGASPATATATFSYTYDARGMKSTVTKPNGNVAKYTYYQDGLVHTSVETTAKDKGQAVVAQHTLDYNEDGDRTLDVSKIDQAASTGTLDQTATYSYTPTQKLAKVTKTGADPGDNETYVYDAAGNITCQTIGAAITRMAYDRDRLTAAGAGSCTAALNYTHTYDAFGRETGSTYGSVVLERHAYDGFDREVRYQRYDGTGALTVSKANTFDPFDRTVTEVTAIPAKPTVTQRFTYLGVTEQVAIEEQQNSSGVYEVSKRYAYGPSGEQLQLVDTPVNGTTTKTYYYGTNPHGDVETLTDASSGQTTSTYRYNAFGSPDRKGTTGEDALSTATGADAMAADTDVVNPYRFNGKRFHGGTGQYDMGFRNYNPAIGRFLTRDLYNGALNDMALGQDPWNANRYAFAGGNPITGVELDGHRLLEPAEGGGSATPGDLPAATDAHFVRESSGSGTATLAEHMMQVKNTWNGSTMPTPSEARNFDAWQDRNFRAPDPGPNPIDMLIAGVTAPWHDAEGCADHHYSDCAWLWLDLFLIAFPEGRLAGTAKTGGTVTRDSKAGVEAAKAGDEAFHYTSSRWIESITTDGLRKGSYATPNGSLSPLQASLELALPPNRALPDAAIRIDLAGLRKAGYEIPTPRRVSSTVTGAGGRTYSMPGGGYEIQFPYSIPPEFLKVVPR